MQRTARNGPLGRGPSAVRVEWKLREAYPRAGALQDRRRLDDAVARFVYPLENLTARPIVP
jgi:hypothetical protein